MDKLAPFRAPLRLPDELDQTAPFAPKDVERPRAERENFTEASAQLQRDLDKAAELDPERDAYLSLPTGIRQSYSRAEYLWLSDAEKSTLVQRECEPDC